MIPKDNALLSSNGVSPASPRELLDGGSKGDSAAAPSLADFGAPKNVASPLLGTLNPVQTDGINLVPKKKGRPRSCKKKIKFSVSQQFANRLGKESSGIRGRAVEIGTTLFLDRLGIDGWTQVRSELVDLSIRVQQLLEDFENEEHLSIEQRTKLVFLGSKVLSRIATLIRI